MPTNKKFSKSKDKKNGTLKTSFLLFSTTTVVTIVIALSLAFCIIMIKQQERALSKGFYDRVSVFLSSVFSGAKNCLLNPNSYSDEENIFASQLLSFPEAEYFTLTGKSVFKMNNDLPKSFLNENVAKDFLYSKDENFSENSNENSRDLLYVWLSNDSEIYNKVNSVDLENNEISGISFLCKNCKDELKAANFCSLLNEKATIETKDLTERLFEVSDDAKNASDFMRIQLNRQIKDLNNRIQNKLSEIADKSFGSVPEYNQKKLCKNSTEYLFFRPILFKLENSSDFVQGIFFLKVNTESLVKSLDKTKKLSFFIVGLISLVSILTGFFASNIFARRMNIKERTIDSDFEKQRLKTKAQETKESETTAMQQSMISLEPLSESGNFKKNISSISDKNVTEFAYYKGAAEASGDYFDFKKLDERYYVLIKCDASGHDSPAGILVTIVATLYKKYFESWNFNKNGTRINEFIYQVNDFLESLNIKGKFVAMILCLYDSKTGTLYISHAGDRIVRIYDSDLKIIKKIELCASPAVGAFSSSVLNEKCGFKVEKIELKPKDVLLLYTDGIEESARIVRTSNASFALKPKLDSKGKPILDENKKPILEAESETFGEIRISQIVQSVFAKQKYILFKKKSLLESKKHEDDSFEFDFTKCKGTPEEAILALASIEKVFRLYKPQGATLKNLVEVDRSIDLFLKKYFPLYSKYAFLPTKKSFIKGKFITPKNPNNVFYSYLKEDSQNDDLTMICLMRN